MKKILLLIITAIIITISLPQRNIIDTQVNLGERWSGKTIYAPFDIPIQKTNQELEADRNEVLSSFIPIFRKDEASSVGYAVDAVNEIYKAGVISQSELGRLSVKKIRVVEGNEITTVPVRELYTPEQAQNILSKQGYVVDVTPNLVYDEYLTSEARRDQLNEISTTKGMVRKNEVVVANNQIIDQRMMLLLDSFYNAYRLKAGSMPWLWSMIGRFMLIVLILGVNVMFFSQFAQLYFGGTLKPLIFTYVCYVVMAALVGLMVRFQSLSPYMVPLPIVAIYLITFFNMRVAIFGNISVAMICAIFVKDPFSFFVLNFIGGMVAIFMMRHMYHRSHLFKAVGVVFGIELLVVFCQEMVSGDWFKVENTYFFVILLINNFLLLGFYQVIYLIEHTFGFVSDLTLLELSDTNQTLLKNMAQQAPGTFQHSVQVANLAEGAAQTIGARPLLARCGALYHDIGKMTNPFYFTENQTGVFNPHNDLDPISSAEIIKSHVSSGVEVARKHKIPHQIIDFIEQHHANSVIYYFFKKAQTEYGEDAVDENSYRYPGVCPSSKEVSICMMADAVEAASRSLPSYDKEPLENLVDYIVDSIQQQGLLVNSELTFAEVGQIKAFFKQKLNNIYHARIAYPKREEVRKQES